MAARGGKSNRKHKARRGAARGSDESGKRTGGAGTCGVRAVKDGDSPPGSSAREQDAPARIAEGDRRELTHKLWIHPELCDRLRGHEALYKRLGIVLEQLAAHGRTAVVKSASDENRGWLRSPLGGNGGRQYYLWWAHEGTARTRHLDAPAGTIIVRAARHHDEHGVLDGGTGDDYLRLAHGGDIDEDIAGRPWTDEQERFVRSANGVRLIHGRPGSGKTTALWRAVEARTDERVLYITWSKALSRAAEEHFACFAPRSVDVQTVDYLTLVSRILRRDVEQLPLQTSMKRFEAELKKLNLDIPAPWLANNEGLFAELRSTLLGKGVYHTTRHGNTVDFDEDRYARNGRGRGFEQRAMRAVVKVARKLSADKLARVFPELAAAAQAVAALAEGRTPADLLNYDRLVIDEAQDLTLVETAVIGELYDRIAESRGERPKLLIAGDAGQTVRPTDFNWGEISRVLSEKVGRTESIALDAHVRCPARIAEVIDHATERYRHLNKDLRPEKQHNQSGAEHVDAQLLYARSIHEEDGPRLVQRLADAEGVAMLTIGETPSWIPAEHAAAVMNAEQCKGLEYQAVVMLNAGWSIDRIDEWAIGDELQPEEEQLMRTSIDQLRVGLSRATETLALVEIASEPEHEEASLSLLGRGAVPCSVDELIDHLTSEVDNEERVLAKTVEATRTFDAAPAKAWRCAEQAFRLLGHAERPNGVSNRHIREETRLTVLDIAARLLARGDAVYELNIAKNDIVNTAMSAICLDFRGSLEKAVGVEEAHRFLQRKKEDPDEEENEEEGSLREEIHAITRLRDWEKQQPERCLLLETAAGLEKKGGARRNWLRETIRANAQSLMKAVDAGSKMPRLALLYETQVIEEWLRQAGQESGVKKKAAELAQAAFDTLAEDLRAGPQGGPGPDRHDALTAILESIGTTRCGAGAWPRSTATRTRRSSCTASTGRTATRCACCGPKQSGPRP